MLCPLESLVQVACTGEVNKMRPRKGILRGPCQTPNFRRSLLRNRCNARR
jgi:hypothetical protein